MAEKKITELTKSEWVAYVTGKTKVDVESLQDKQQSESKEQDKKSDKETGGKKVETKNK